eukprot:15114204-Alexandrium_andersonii.AAC.1
MFLNELGLVEWGRDDEPATTDAEASPEQPALLALPAPVPALPAPVPASSNSLGMGIKAGPSVEDMMGGCLPPVSNSGFVAQASCR